MGTHVLARGVTAFVVTPRDPARTRFNIGVRTLYSGATIQVTQRDANGVTIRTMTRTYTANYSGSAIVYGTTTDNTTNDPAFQCAYGIFAVV